MQSKYSPALERDIQRAIIAALKNRPGGFTMKLAAGPYSTPGVPDVLHIENGCAFFIEVKRPGGRLTALQADMLRKLRAAGAVAGIAYSVEDALQLLQEGRDAEPEA